MPGAKNVNEVPRGNLPGGLSSELKVTWDWEDSQRCDFGKSGCLSEPALQGVGKTMTQHCKVCDFGKVLIIRWSAKTGHKKLPLVGPHG